jgi:hypothetical protein
MGKLENRRPLSIRSNAGRLDDSGGCLGVFVFGLLRLVEDSVVVPSASAVAAAAAAVDFDAERDEEECFCTPPVLETEDLRGAGFAPGGNGFFLGGAICGGRVFGGQKKQLWAMIVFVEDCD